jgi:hypothetical protein
MFQLLFLVTINTTTFSTLVICTVGVHQWHMNIQYHGLVSEFIKTEKWPYKFHEYKLKTFSEITQLPE